MTDSLVDWVEWGPEAFQRAKAENKLILMGISAVWCHWCHVMDQTTYADGKVAELIKRHFIPVRVDNDKRPDVNRRYNMGGWPTTVFLTPEGKVVTGGTYIPPQRMTEILQQLADAWQKNPAALQSGVAEVSPLSVIGGEKAREEANLALLGSVPRMVLGAVVNSFDSLYGGFGLQPKFPHTDALRLALAHYCYTGNGEYLRIVTKTLDAMASGGIWDREEGGFFRYSTMRDWSIPHFEKMSEDNAKLLEAYLGAYEVTGNANYLQVASRIVEYVSRMLTNQKDGGFYGSQDADEEYYGLGWKLRAAKQPPSVDSTIYVNWSALMASSFLHASFTLGRPELRDLACRTLNSLLEQGVSPDGGIKHFISEGQQSLDGLLTDQILMASSLIDAYQATAREEYLSKARELTDFAVKALYDNQGGGFFDRVEASGDWGALKRRMKPLDENSLAADVLLKLHDLLGEETYLRRAEETLAGFQSTYSDHDIMAASYASAVDRFLNLPLRIVIVGHEGEDETQRMLQQCLTVHHPRKLVELLDGTRHAEKIAKLGYQLQQKPTAYVCIGTVCLEPTTETKKVQKLIVDLRRRSSPRTTEKPAP